MSSQAAAQALNILVLTSTLPARPGDGTPEFVLTLSRKLSRSACVTILSPRVRGGVDRVDAVEILRFPYFPAAMESLASDAILPELKRRPWKIIEAGSLLVSFVWNAVRTCRHLRPDVVHAHWIVPGGLAAWVASWITRTPYIVTVHGADAYALNGRLARWLRGLVIARAQRVIPVSRDIASVLGLDTSTALPMGIEVDTWDLPRQPVKRLCGSFVFVGRLAEKKGLTIALRALAKLPDAHLTIVGDGPERTKLETLTKRLRIGNQVTFEGAQPHGRVIECLRKANAALIPSVVASSGDQDGTPLVLAEALALGTPVIASRLGGIVDVVDDTVASLVPPGDVDKLAEAMSFAMANQQMVEERAARARSGALKTVDLSMVANKYMSFLEAAARKPSH